MSKSDWRPGASATTLQARAKLLQTIRQFFAERGVLEVETPQLMPFGVTDVNVQAVAVPALQGYLQTSPEYAMKRLLAAGIGCMYQICRAFRLEPSGSLHHSEFSLLEWYRLGMDDNALAEEVLALLCLVLPGLEVHRTTYQAVFEQYVGVNPHRLTQVQVPNLLARHNIQLSAALAQDLRLSDGLDLLFHHLIEPNLTSGIWAIGHYPKCQAALARVSQQNDDWVAHRFEVYVNGVELANGYFELTCPATQQQRFMSDQTLRQQKNLPPMAIDTAFMAALAHGLPDCAGVALGIDRLLMLQQQLPDFASSVAFCG